LKTKGYFIFKKEWYSICSIHKEYNNKCSNCKTGRWINIYSHIVSSLVYDISPSLWKKIHKNETIKFYNIDDRSIYKPSMGIK
jgi:hypothetical protein